MVRTHTKSGCNSRLLYKAICLVSLMLWIVVARCQCSPVLDSLLDRSESMSDEEPLLTIPADICDIEIEPTSVDLLLVDPLNFYTTYMVPVPCEPPPTQYKCQGCRDKRATVYECYHETMDPNERCDSQYCIKDVLKAKSCYVSNQGAEDCRVLFDQAGGGQIEDNFLVQYKVKATPSCTTNSQQTSLWVSFWVGCPHCVESRIWIRCKASPERCSGSIVDIDGWRGRYFCSPNPCPP
jgi:hypothetical protein